MDDEKQIAALLSAAMITKTHRGGLSAEEAVDVYFRVLSALERKRRSEQGNAWAATVPRGSMSSGSMLSNGTSQTEFYHSENGDRWFLCRDKSGHAFVGHDSNEPSGGGYTPIEIHDFLGVGRAGPEQRALIERIGTLAGV
jgi:hypothetical protein